MGTVEGMLAQSRKLLGTTEHPPGSNHNFITAWYGWDGPWCDMSVSYAAAHSDNLDAVCGKQASTVQHATAFKQAGRWHYGKGGIRPGDIIFFDWSGGGRISGIDHVGIVEAVHNDGTVTTLEGNTSNVFARRRRRSCIVGYGRPAFSNAKPKPSTDGILRQGSKGNAVKALQRNLNTVMKSGLTTDGEFGPGTTAAVKAFQSKYHQIVDGEFGPDSAAMMKGALAGLDRPKPPVPRPPTSAKLAEDGEFGPATCAALQRALNRHGNALGVDGAMGPLTNKALQKYVGVPADGIVGPGTVAALQRKLGVTADGDWGKNTNIALQRRLNAGTF